MKQQINARDKKKLLISALLFAVVLVAIGYMSLSQSNYKSVADLADVKKRVKVTVEGNVTPIGEGVYRLIVGGKTYIVEAHRSYGVAYTDDGHTYGVFLLSSGNFTVLALYDAGSNLSAYQMGSGLAGQVVVAGVYDPNVRAKLVWNGGSVELPFLQVDSILKGCHSSYQQGVASRG
ncbi:MAG: hypothetical protein F7C35_03945 [Desulfurococcales archaeon]|nr:hypothetical protein [Desulfurococcales archaeon]